MDTQKPPSSEREWSPSVIAITVGTPALMLLFGLMWVASQIGKLHSLPTIAVWATIIFAFALFALGIFEIVLYHHDSNKSVWYNFWIAVEGIGIGCVAFVIAWAYRSPNAHALVIAGGVLMFQGWVLYGYQRRVTDKMVADEPHVPFIAIATLTGIVGAAFTWFLQHPPAAAFIQQTALPSPAADPRNGAAMLGADIGEFFRVVGAIVVVLAAVKIVMGIIKFFK